jgi:hypothetical protein
MVQGHYMAVQGGARQYKVMQCNVGRCEAMQIQRKALQGNAVQCKEGYVI